MADFSTINEFRKQRFNELHQDPTYLSFFLLFDFHTENSPIFNGEAEKFLREVLREEERADALVNFKRILQKINKELPWYWQSLSGLEVAKTFGEMKEPFHGAEKPQLEIECLENVEFTILGLIDLYRRACFDYHRFVEVLPRNLRYFTMWVFITELRTFQSDTNAHNLSSNYRNESNINLENKKKINQKFVGSSKPFFEMRLDFCEFNPDSSLDTFSELQKNPENATANLNIFWNRAEQIDQKYLTSIINNDSDLTSIERDRTDNSEELGPAEKMKENFEEGVNNSVQSIKAGARNLQRSVEGGPGLYNVHNSILTGAARSAVNSASENLASDIFLSNIHGIDKETRINNAIDIASINGLKNIHENELT